VRKSDKEVIAMNEFIPHQYQQECVDAVVERSSVALWLEMGLG
jgi:hypothetical protein